MTGQALTLSEVGRRLGVSRWTVRAWIDRGVLPAVEVAPNRYRVPAPMLDAWLTRGDGRGVDLKVRSGGRTPRRAA